LPSPTSPPTSATHPLSLHDALPISSIGDTTSAAATRPCASASGTRSTRAVGRTAVSRRRRASSSEIVDVNGLIVDVRSTVWDAYLLRGLFDEVPQLRNDQALHREAHRRL